MREGMYRHARLRTTLLVFQTMLSVVLLIGAGLFTRSLSAVRALRLGYDVDPLVVARYAPRGVKLSPVEVSALGDRLVAEARTIPGVVNASLNISIPFNSSEGRSIYVAGIDSIRKLGRFQLQAGSPEFFSTTGTRVLRGRAFTADDRGDAPRVVVVSEAMGKVLWKGDDPIGKCIRIGRDTMPCTTVIGIAENTRSRGLTDDNELTYYMPMAQYRVVFGPTTPTLYVRVRNRADDYAETIRARLQRVVPGPGYVMTTPFHTLVDPTRQSWESGATMFMAFGGLALALAAIGLYAVIAFSVSQRTQELGVRIALGALPRDVLRLVVAEGARVTVVGVAIGVGIALMASRGIAPLLFGVSARDPLVYATVGLVLIGVGVAASLIPASRAARVDPNTALRVE
jgi:predicted permease